MMINIRKCYYYDKNSLPSEIAPINTFPTFDLRPFWQSKREDKRRPAGVDWERQTLTGRQWSWEKRWECNGPVAICSEKKSSPLGGSGTRFWWRKKREVREVHRQEQGVRLLESRFLQMSCCHNTFFLCQTTARKMDIDCLYFISQFSTHFPRCQAQSTWRDSPNLKERKKKIGLQN